MPNINDMMPSRFLKKENVMPEKSVTIHDIKVENISKENDIPEMKVVIYFHEFNQGMVLNQINKEMIILALGSDQTEQWIGKQITLWNDPSVGFGGKVTGGIRVRLPQHIPQQVVTETAVNPSTPRSYDNNGLPLY